MGTHRSTRCALAALLLAAGTPARAVSSAPLGVATPGPFRGLFLDMPLAEIRGAAAPSAELRWWLQNDWSIPTRLSRGGRVVDVQEDAQTDVLQLRVAVPWSALAKERAAAARISTTLEVRLLERWGGWTDQPIEAWHGLVDSWNFERELHRRGAVGLVLEEEDGARLAELHSPRLALSDVAVRTAIRLAGPDPDLSPGAVAPWALALRVDLKLPTGSVGRLSGSGGFDAGVGLAASAALSRWLAGHALASLRVVSDLPRAFPLQPNRLQGGLDLSLVARLGARVAVVLEDRVSSALFRGGWTLPPTDTEPEATAYYALFRPHNEVSVGLRVGDLTAFLSEDFTPGGRLRTDPGPRWFYDSNAPDLVFGLAWTRGL
jgi:hypothetical protein